MGSQFWCKVLAEKTMQSPSFETHKELFIKPTVLTTLLNQSEDGKVTESITIK